MASNNRAAEPLSPLARYWDAVVQGRPADLADFADLDPALAATVRRLHAEDDALGPDPIFAARLLADLEKQRRRAPLTFPPRAVAVDERRNRHDPPARVSGLPTAIAAPRTLTQWNLGPLAAIAIILLLIVGGVLVVGRHRLGQQPAAMVIPARREALATPASRQAPRPRFLWQANGGPSVPFGQPDNPAIGPRGDLWVADGEHARFVIFAPDGSVRETWGTAGDGEGEFDFACSPGLSFGAVAFDAAGNIYVADAGNRRIQKFAADRTFLASWGTKGTGDRQFLCPAAIAIDRQGRVYVSDEGWGKIKVYTSDGVWLATWSNLAAPMGITVAADGDIWVADFGGRVVQFAPDGRRLAVWSTAGAGNGSFLYPKSVAVDAQGRVFVPDFDRHRILIFAPDGSLLGAWGERGDAAGQFQQPDSIVLDGQGNVYVAEEQGKRIQKFQLLPLPADG